MSFLPRVKAELHEVVDAIEDRQRTIAFNCEGDEYCENEFCDSCPGAVLEEALAKRNWHEVISDCSECASKFERIGLNFHAMSNDDLLSYFYFLLFNLAKEAKCCED